MAVSKNRKQKEKEYKEKYGQIPIDLTDRLTWMIGKYNISQQRMEEILEKRQMMMNNLFFYDYDIIELLEEPEGASRPKVRVMRGNFNKLAKADPMMVHIYVPGASDDRNFMTRLIDERELDKIDNFIYTPCQIEYNIFLKTPSYMNVTDTFLAEIGLIRPPFSKPDWDNAGKKYCDMFNSNIWMDDTLVIDGSVHKYYSILPRVQIRLRYLNALYTKQMQNSIINRKDFNNSTVQYLDRKGELKS